MRVSKENKVWKRDFKGKVYRCPVGEGENDRNNITGRCMDAWMHNLSNPVQTAHEGALRDILGIPRRRQRLCTVY